MEPAHVLHLIPTQSERCKKSIMPYLRSVLKLYRRRNVKMVFSRLDEPKPLVDVELGLRTDVTDDDVPVAEAEIT